jgi:hypothetical protein
MNLPEIQPGPKSSVTGDEYPEWWHARSGLGFKLTEGTEVANVYENLNYRVLHPVARNINCK